MTRSIEADYSERYLFPPSVEDWVGEDHPARFIRAVVEALDLEGLGLEAKPGGEGAERGRPHYGFRLLLKAWLYGYLNNIRSPRQLEKACRENVGLIWLLGRAEPDHNTLWRFWHRHRQAIGEVFKQVVGIAVQAGVVGVVLHAVDGTKIQARGSSRRARVLSRMRLERQLRKLDELQAEIEEEIQANRRKGEATGYRLPEELKDAERLRERIQAAKKRLDEARTNHLNEGEPEARMMPCEGTKRLAYNAQTVVDEQSGVIVAQGVVDRAVDNEELIPLLEKTRESVGTVAADTVADKGYRSDQALGEAAQRGYSVLVNLYETEGERANRLHGSRFQFDREQDRCVCPRGQELTFNGYRRSRHGWKDRRYVCPQWKQCPEADQCSGNQRGRQILIGPHREAVDAQRARQRQPEEKEKLRRRKMIVEPVFAHLKANAGFRRWTSWGLQAAQSQWSMLCTGYNLRKLLPLWQNGAFEIIR